jgi:hypothetical protein
MPNTTSLDRFTSPLGGEEIELQTLTHDAGGLTLLRVRIREKRRFTVVDIDPLTARRFAEAMLRYADAHGASRPVSG